MMAILTGVRWNPSVVLIGISFKQAIFFLDYFFILLKYFFQQLFKKRYMEGITEFLFVFDDWAEYTFVS
jgi:hypothetical protein